MSLSSDEFEEQPRCARRLRERKYFRKLGINAHPYGLISCFGALVFIVRYDLDSDIIEIK
jgi:hypothetical protein